MTKFLISILLAANTFFSCNPQIIKTNAKDISEDSLTYEIETLSDQFGNCDSTIYSNECARIEISFPKFKNKNPVSDSINSVIQNYVLIPISEEQPNSIQEKIELYLNDYKDLIKVEPNYKTGWFSELSGKVIRNDKNFVVLKFSEVNFSGGAHPNSFVKFINLDSQTGKFILKKDLLKDEKQLEKIAENIFRTQKQIPTEKSLSDYDYFWVGGKFYLNENFAILDSGLVFLYNNYEIAPYSQGQTEVFLPNSAISKFVKRVLKLSK